MRLSKEARRLAIFAYYDADGAIDDYVFYLLEQTGRFCAKQIVVVNGTLAPEAEKQLKRVAAHILYRPNEGYDITAYREGFLSEWESGAQYDEVLFYNQTIFGPVCPLDALFEEMAARDVDFWGLTRHKGAPQASWNEKVVILPHVQSFFFAVRGAMLHSPEFLRYWRELPRIESYWDAVEKHEIVFTAHFAALGYRWDTYVDTAALERFNDYPLMGCPEPLLRAGCPFFKRKSFVERRFDYAAVPHGEAVWSLYRYLREETQYPLRFLAQNLMRTVETALVTQALAPYFDVESYAAQPGVRCAAVVYVGQDAMAERLMEAASRLSGQAEVFLLFADEALCGRFAPQTPPGVQVYVTDCPGPRYLFETLWPRVSGSPWLCYLTNDLPPLLGQFADMTSLVEALESVAQPQCAAILEAEPVFGLLLPPMPSHQETLALGARLPRDRELTADILRTGGMRVPIAAAPGLASRGGAFFARTAALAGLARIDWSRKELFEGMYPLWELLPPLAAQSAGFMTGFAACTRRAFIEWENHRAMLGAVGEMWGGEDRVRIDQMLFRMRQLKDFFDTHRYQMTLEQASDRTRFGFKQRLWFCLQILLKPQTFARLTEKWVRHR